VPSLDLKLTEAAIGPETAAILIEPIQGEGGIRLVPPELLAGLRRLCDEKGILLILDEIQCGMGRTGKLFAHEWAGITPDIMAIAKALGGGFPIGACLATGKAASGMTLGSHGSTFGGNPLAVAVGNAVLDEVLKPGFLEAVRQRGLRLKQALAELIDTYPHVLEEVRGDGLMLGLKCRLPVGDVIAAFVREGLLAVPAGDNVVRILPPLIVAEEDIAAGLERMRRAMASLPANRAAAAG
jgi:acetylornithine/N-succinyldiaminopimelate aminotransferase